MLNFMEEVCFFCELQETGNIYSNENHSEFEINHRYIEYFTQFLFYASQYGSYDYIADSSVLSNSL